MGYSVVRVEEIEPAGPGGFAMVAVAARQGSCEPRGPF